MLVLGLLRVVLSEELGERWKGEWLAARAIEEFLGFAQSQLLHQFDLRAWYMDKMNRRRYIGNQKFLAVWLALVIAAWTPRVASLDPQEIEALKELAKKVPQFSPRLDDMSWATSSWLLEPGMLGKPPGKPWPTTPDEWPLVCVDDDDPPYGLICRNGHIHGINWYACSPFLKDERPFFDPLLT